MLIEASRFSCLSPVEGGADGGLGHLKSRALLFLREVRPNLANALITDREFATGSGAGQFDRGNQTLNVGFLGLPVGLGRLGRPRSL